MAERYTLARPYAEAVYELAEEQGAEGLAQWSEALTTLAAVVRNDSVAVLMHNPRVSNETLGDVIIAAGDSVFGDKARNLVHLLIDNDRLTLAPEIAELFEARRASTENRIDVEVVSAVALSDEQQQSLGQALEQRFGRAVSMRFEQDDSMIAGAVIRADDMVIDGSLTAQLERMRRSLAN